MGFKGVCISWTCFPDENHLIVITSSFYCTYTDYPDSQPVPNKRLRLTSGGDDSLCYNGGQMVEPGIGQSLSKYISSKVNE